MVMVMMLRFSLELKNPPEPILGYLEFADKRNGAKLEV